MGIGFSVDEDANFVVSKLVPGSPAALSRRIKKDDVLVSVDGMDLDDLSIKDVVKLLKGPVGTSVALDLARGGKAFGVPLTRNHAVAPKSSSSMAAGLFNSVSGMAGMASTSLSSLTSTSMSTLSGAAGGASAAFSGSLSSGLCLCLCLLL